MNYKEASTKYRTAWKGEKAGHAGDEKLMDFSKLVPVDSGGPNRKLIAPAAASYNKIKNAIGGTYDVSLGKSTFRPRAPEVTKCADPDGSKARKRKRKEYCDGKSKARPGYSRHGWGRAIDLALIGGELGWNMGYDRIPPRGTKARGLFDWLAENALNYGWVNYRGEAWHWEYVGEPPGVYPNPAIRDNPEYTPTPQTDLATSPGSGYERPEQSNSAALSELSQLLSLGGVTTPASGATSPKDSKETATDAKPDIESVSEPTVPQDKIDIDLTGGDD